jgi:hypothetical protein
MNPTDEVVATAERPEMAGSDDWLSKFDERYRAALKDVQRPSNQLKAVENSHGSDDEFNERLDDLPRPRPLPKQVEDLLSLSSQHSTTRLRNER